MDLPDCPPGAEGYEDTVIEMPKRPDMDDNKCTKAELEFKEHLNSLKIKVENGTTRCMVERRGRDVAGKWIYLCYPCAAVCSGEAILQTHISGKKHKTKLALRTVWPMSIFEEHPYIKKGESTQSDGCDEKTLQKMADVVSMHNLDTKRLDSEFSKYRYSRTQIQDTLDKLKTPLLGVEYLVEFPGEEAHHEPSYTCLLCNKQGAPRTIINHMVSYWHRIHYLWRHFPTTHSLLQPYRTINKYREGVIIVMNRLVHRIEESYGRLKPLSVDKTEFNSQKEQITQWVFKGYHFSEKNGQTFAEVVDTDLITSLEKGESNDKEMDKKKDPSPPVVAAPSRSKGAVRCERRPSVDELSDDLSIEEPDRKRDHRRDSPRRTYSYRKSYKDRPSPYPRRFSPRTSSRERYKVSERIMPKKEGKYDFKPKPQNTEYKMMMAADQTRSAEQAAGKILAYHEKNPEKHPLYPEEWKKFWNKRYKELQAEGKDASKYDFKPEWIVFWTKRMKELHDEELSREVIEIHRRLNLPPPEDRSRRSPQSRRRSRSPAKHRDRSPPPRRRSLTRRHSRSPRRHRSRSPIHRNRSPAPRKTYPPGSNPYVWRRDQSRRSVSPLSVREAKMGVASAGARSRSRGPSTVRSKQSPVRDTVLISDDELKEDPHSPWNGSDSLDSLGSLPDAKSPPVSAGSGNAPRPVPRHTPHTTDSPDDVVSSLRLLVALEDYLGSLGPKIVDLLALALKMEKEKPNSSEQLLENEMSISLIETAKEKLKGAVQAGLVMGGAAAAARKAITRAAALLHEADKRQRTKNVEASKNEALPVAGVGAVDKAAIAKQMAAALIAQGKTDVTTEELAQLVDAVVGMAAAKKREADKAVTVVKTTTLEPTVTKTPSGSALQLLKSAYDENDKKMDKEGTPDVMDGLSDSDLKTLLQNFAELSAEEQHGLIAYLKKLEAKDPRRVEQLREYVSAAVSAGPAPDRHLSPPSPTKPPPVAAATATLTIDSEDDDYTVEEVFKSAAEKIKENQIRQEMEVVKKLLSQDTKPKEPELEAVDVPIPTSKEQSSSVQTSAANVLALMQASVHLSTKSTEVPPVPIPMQNSQLNLFGDKSVETHTAPIPTNVTDLLAALSGNKTLSGAQSSGNQQNQNYEYQNTMGVPNQNRPNQNEWQGSVGVNDSFGMNKQDCSYDSLQSAVGGNYGANQYPDQQGYGQSDGFSSQGLYGQENQWNELNNGPYRGSESVPQLGGYPNNIAGDYTNSGQYGDNEGNLTYGDQSYQQDRQGNQWDGPKPFRDDANAPQRDAENQFEHAGGSQLQHGPGSHFHPGAGGQLQRGGGIQLQRGGGFQPQRGGGIHPQRGGAIHPQRGGSIHPQRGRGVQPPRGGGNAPIHGGYSNSNSYGANIADDYANSAQYGETEGNRTYQQDEGVQENKLGGPRSFRGGNAPQRGGYSNTNSYEGNNADEYSNSGNQGENGTCDVQGYQQDQYAGSAAPPYGRGGYNYRGNNAPRRPGGGRGRGRGRGPRGYL